METIPQWTMADRLRKARESAELDQQQLADRIGISRQTVSNYERGYTARRPMRTVVRQWALATGVPESWLRYGDVRDVSDQGDIVPGGGRSTGWFHHHGAVAVSLVDHLTRHQRAARHREHTAALDLFGVPPLPLSRHGSNVRAIRDRRPPGVWSRAAG